jgi:hypothetical protein
VQQHQAAQQVQVDQVLSFLLALAFFTQAVAVVVQTDQEVVQQADLADLVAVAQVHLALSQLL